MPFEQPNLFFAWLCISLEKSSQLDNIGLDSFVVDGLGLPEAKEMTDGADYIRLLDEIDRCPSGDRFQDGEHYHRLPVILCLGLYAERSSIRKIFQNNY